jgi:predicted ATPase/DNA-binding CsgD family transcriptional regulator
MSGSHRTSPDRVPNNLPTHLTTFVGRERELGELTDILATTRLLTLTGTGGCGKSRLASRLGREVLGRYPDGAWWLELAPVSDPALVEAALAAAICVRPLPGRTPLEASIAHLAGLRAVVLFDNCEHVLDPCRYLVAELLRGCSEVSVVATSREPLGVGGETTWRVPSLSLPRIEARDASSEPTEVTIEDSDAAKLFIERAKKVRPEFALSAERSVLVGRICEELDGIPLAIELAAVRVRVLPLERIAVELADRFRLLTGGERGVLPRLQTLRSSVDWSYELLEPPERTLLRRCGVFSGGFTLEACEAVCADGDLEQSAVLDLVTSLVDKSLLLVDEQREVRFGMLETIRQYALERLTEAEELVSLQDRHANAYLVLAEATAPNLGGDVGSDDVLGADAANLYAAIEHLSRTVPEQALRCCNALAYWWLLTGRLVEGPAALSLSLDAASELRSQRTGSALFWRGYLAFFAGDYPSARKDANEALAVAREFRDAATEGRVLNTLGLLETQSDPRASLPLLERACELARAATDPWCLAEATQNIGWARMLMGRYADARVALADAFEIAERNGWRELIAWHLLFLGHTQYPTGDLGSARALWERGLDGASDVQEGFALWSLALVDVDEGRANEALVRLASGRERMIVSGAGLGLQFVESGIGLAHAALGNLDRARQLLSAAADQHSRGFVWTEASTLCDLARVERLLGDHASAHTSAEKALGIAEHLSHAGLASRARGQLAALAAETGEWATAGNLVHQALRDQVESGDHIDMPESLEVLAEVALGLGRLSEAARVLGAATRARSDLGRAPWLPEGERLEQLRLRIHTGLGADAFAQAWTEGDGMKMSDAIEYARRARGTRQRPSRGWESLTPTELAIVRHVAVGLTNPEIAERMFISRGTVKMHLSHIYTKVGLRNRSEVAAEVIRRNLLEGP